MSWLIFYICSRDFFFHKIFNFPWIIEDLRSKIDSLLFFKFFHALLVNYLFNRNILKLFNLFTLFLNSPRLHISLSILFFRRHCLCFLLFNFISNWFFIIFRLPWLFELFRLFEGLNWSFKSYHRSFIFIESLNLFLLILRKSINKYLVLITDKVLCFS
jgi:hypothetical protein